MINDNTEAAEENTSPSFLAKVHNLSMSGLLIGGLANFNMDSFPKLTATAALLKYALPIVSVAGASIAIEFESRKPKTDGPKNFGELKEQFSARNAKFMATFALATAGVLGGSFFAEKAVYDYKAQRAEEKARVEKLPVLSAQTIVREQTIRTTAFEDACFGRTSGVVSYVSPLDKKEYQVSCVQSAPNLEK